nr:MAG TPA: Portal protein [Caudoviricetes sp.]
MALFKKDETPKNLTSEIGFAGDIVFESFDREESRTDDISIKDYRRMLDSDTTVEALYNIFTMSILAATYHIDADREDTDEAQAEFVRRNLLEPPHKGGMQTPISLFIDQSLIAIYEGFALFEKVYELRDGKLVLKRLAHRDSTTLTLIRDDVGGFGGAKQRTTDATGAFQEVTIPAYKCFLFTYGKNRNYLYGRSAFKSLYPRYDKKRRLEYLDSVALQADAIKPKVLKRTVDGVVSEQLKKARNKALEVLGRLGKHNSVASIPYGYDLDVLNTEGRDPHQSIERQNSEMARAFHASVILTATQGSASNVGSYSLSTNQKDLLQTAITGVMRLLESHINQYLIADLIDLNFAERHYPEFHFDTPDESIISAVFEAFKLLVQKDRISDDIATGIEESTATRLGIDLDAIKKRRQEEPKDEKADNDDSDNDKSGGNGGDADKFLDENDKIDEVVPPEPHEHITIDRDLTDAEKRVKFDTIQDWMKEQEDSFAAAATEELNKAIDNITLDEAFSLPTSYTSLIAKYYRTAYNYGKLSAADEQKLPAPALKEEYKLREKQYVDFIVGMQNEDVNNIITGELLKQPINLADEPDEDVEEIEPTTPAYQSTTQKSAVLEAIKISAGAWVAQAVLGTKGTIISQGMNDGRDDSFASFDEDDDTAVYQWSALMEKNTCPICAELDGKVISANERKTMFQRPPKHINCRCIWTRISALDKEYKLPEITGIDEKTMKRIETAQFQSKAVIDLPSGVSKKAAIASAKVDRHDPLYMTPAEMEFFNRWKDKLDLKRLPNKGSQPSNDFSSYGKEVELKSIAIDLKPTTVRNTIFRATDKGKRNIYLDIVNRNTSIDAVARDARQHLATKRRDGSINGDLVDSLVIFKGNKFIKIK